MRFLNRRSRRRYAVLALSVAALSSTALMLSSGAGGTETLTAAPGAVETLPSAPRLLLAQNATTKVSYSTAQAARGQKQFTQTCVDCHGEDLRGGLNGGPPLRGGSFNQHFAGGPASALFLFMSTLMPPEAPGRFSESVYADLMAYVLQVNGFEAGAELPSNVDALGKLVLEK
jgi:mono/diheme cytochrome c family protein